MSDLLRQVRAGLQRHWRRAHRRWSAPVIDAAQIRGALQQLAAPAPQVVMVHSSLSACGTIAGGAETVLGALREWLRAGTLVMPTHSYCYPAAGDAPVFDPSVTASVVGAITNAFWRSPGVRRSLHPTHSLAAEGAAADVIVRDHETCRTPCGTGSPYERLVMMDAAVLMFGAGMDAYTFFHTAEDAAIVPYLYMPTPVLLRYRTPDGRVQTMTMRRHDTTLARSFGAKSAWLHERGLLTRVQLGTGELLFIRSARSAHEALVAQLRARPTFLLSPSAA